MGAFDGEHLCAIRGEAVKGGGGGSGPWGVRQVGEGIVGVFGTCFDTLHRHNAYYFCRSLWSSPVAPVCVCWGEEVKAIFKNFSELFIKQKSYKISSSCLRHR